MRINLSTYSRQIKAGAFLLMETMVGMLVVGIVFVALYTGISSGFAVIQVAEENARATQILEEKLETIRLYTWAQLNTANFVPTNFTVAYSTNSSLVYTGAMQITAAPVSESYSNSLKSLNVTVTWKSGRVVRTRQMSTLISQFGIQNYVY
jgi:type II secretory pathway pseudopilin PulG